MKTFEIVQFVDPGVVRRKINGRLTETVQAIVRFPDGDTTRHLQRHDGMWIGWNSDRAKRERAGIISTYLAHKAELDGIKARITDATAKLTALKGKRKDDAAKKRQILKSVLAASKAELATAAADLAGVAKFYAEVDETHPELVIFDEGVPIPAHVAAEKYATEKVDGSLAIISDAIMDVIRS